MLGPLCGKFGDRLPSSRHYGTRRSEIRHLNTDIRKLPEFGAAAIRGPFQGGADILSVL